MNIGLSAATENRELSGNDDLRHATNRGACLGPEQRARNQAAMSKLTPHRQILDLANSELESRHQPAFVGI